MKCNTATIDFGHEKFLGLKEARIDILSSTRSSITWLIFFFEETLTYANFLPYQNFTDTIKAYADFLQKFLAAIVKVSSIKERRIKHNSKK